MNFIEGLQTYFQRILDPASYIVAGLFSLSLTILFFPNRWSKRAILKVVLIFLAVYGVKIVFDGFWFAVVNALPGDRFMIKGAIFSMAPLVFIVIYLLVFNRKRLKIRLLTSLLLIATTIVVSAMSKNLGLYIGEISQNHPVGVSFARTLPYVLLVIACLEIRYVDISKYDALPKEIVILLISVSSVLIGVGTFEHFYDDQEAIVTILLSVIDFLLLMVLDFVYLALTKNVETRQKILELEIKNNLVNAEVTAIKIDRANREELQKLRHDIKNQLSYVGMMLDNGDVDGAKGYIEEYTESNSKVLDGFSCSNETIHSIVNLELTKAKIQGKKLDAKAIVPPSLPFSKTDLCSLLTNMVDNALENYYSEDGKPIELRIFKQNDFIRFVCSNPVDPNKLDKKNLTQSKKGPSHGYGTRIIRSVAATYGGLALFTAENGQFVCDVVLNLEYGGTADA